jgi:GLPGLI family protein
MKIFFLALGCFLSASLACAQQPDTAIGKVTYDFIHLRDTANRNQPYKETMTLLLGRNASVYRSLDKQLQAERLARQILDQVKSAPNPNSVDLTIKSSGPVTNEEYFQYLNRKKLYIEENVVNYYLVEEPLPHIDWKIQDDTLSFGALHCQKAIAHFKGRDYTAWFCADLPFRNGPWKLSGLPGLIIEAYDSEKEVLFKFDGFEDVSKLHLAIVPPADDIVTTRQQIERLKQTRKNDPAGFNKAVHGSGSAHRASPMDVISPEQIHSINVVRGTGGNTNIINNPIELPEKK